MQELEHRIRSLELQVVAIRARQNTNQRMMETILERLGATKGEIARLRPTPEELQLLADEHEELCRTIASRKLQPLV